MSITQSCREDRLAEREARLLDRMDDLLTQQAELRERDHARHMQREERLQAQVDTLLHYVATGGGDATNTAGGGGGGAARPALEAPAAASQHRSSTFVPPAAKQPAQGNGGPAAAPAAPAADVVGAVASGAAAHQTGSEQAPQAGAEQQSMTPSAQATVADAMRAVAEGADVLSDLPFGGTSDPIAPAATDSSAQPSKASSGIPAQPPTPPPSPPPAPQQAQAGTAPPSAASARGGAVTGVGSIAEAMAVAQEYRYEGPVETTKAPQDGPPPVLTEGDDDIFWVAKLQVRLLTAISRAMSSCHLLCLLSS